MNSREKFLVSVILGIVVLGVGYYGLTRVTSKFHQRRSQINQLTADIELENVKVMAGIRAQRELSALAEKALTYTRDEAQQLYMQWLTDWADRNELGERKMKVESVRSRTLDEREIYRTHSFSLGGKTDLAKLTKMLYEFETANQLHRIRALTVTPKGEKELDVYVTIDAVALPMAEDRETIGVDSEMVAAVGPLEQFQEPIFQRNLFGPENNAPRLGVRSSYTVELGDSLRMDLDGKDPDDVDNLIYAADLEGLEGARLSGDRLEWRPKELGDYYAKVEVQDDGYPRLSHQREVKISVVKPKPTPPPTPPAPRPVFDYAAYTQLNAIIIKSGEPTAWLWVRPTDERLKLKVGEKFKIGELEGRMTEIDFNSATFESEGKIYRVGVRGFVGKAKHIGNVEADEKDSQTVATEPPENGEKLLPPLEELPTTKSETTEPTEPAPAEATVDTNAEKSKTDTPPVEGKPTATSTSGDGSQKRPANGVKAVESNGDESPAEATAEAEE